MQRTEDGYIITNDDIRKARDILGYIGVGIILIESIRVVFGRPWMRLP